DTPRAPTRHDNIDFRPIITRTSNILPLSVVAADKGYDSEDNHLLVRESLYSVLFQLDMKMFQYRRHLVWQKCNMGLKMGRIIYRITY
ncbi:MAG: hypothetical protein WCF07_11040, partial [Nitrososphaeraceae archaeon]